MCWKLSDVAAGKLRSGLKGCVVMYVCTCECVFGEKRKNGEEEGQITLLTY